MTWASDLESIQLCCKSRERPSAPTRRVTTMSRSQAPAAAASLASAPAAPAPTPPTPVGASSHAESASAPSPALSRTKKRPETTSESSPSRTICALARSPISNLHAESSAVLPAPVSPVSTVNPAHGVSVALRISAKFSTWISSIMSRAPFFSLRYLSLHSFPSVYQS